MLVVRIVTTRQFIAELNKSFTPPLSLSVNMLMPNFFEISFSMIGIKLDSDIS
jgi:hypothetical protein